MPRGCDRLASSTPGICAKARHAVFGYGYQFWTFPSEKRRFALLGVYGQSIFVDPELKLVMVVTAAAKNASVGKEPFAAERSALWRGLVGKIRKLVASGRQAHDIVQINRDHIQSDHTEEFPCEPWSSFS